MAKKTKPALIEEAHSLGVDVDDDENYDDIFEKVKKARETAESEYPLVEPPDDGDDPEEEKPSGRCVNCSREAVVVDDANGAANPVAFCRVHAPR